MRIFLFVFLVLISFISCKSIDFDQVVKDEEVSEIMEPNIFLFDLPVQKEPEIVYIEKPVYYPVENKISPEKSDTLTGSEAAKQSVKSAVKTPENFTNAVHFYQYDETFIYEVYCQRWRLTDIQLEPGEEVLEIPYLSETDDKVWQISAGVSKSNEMDVQHFFLKPSHAGLTTTMIIMTNRRVYHLLLKSFNDFYMPVVRWTYPNKLPYITVKSDNTTTETKSFVDPLLLSPDYKVNFLYKVDWLPTFVFDDGAKTYIVLNPSVLHTELPVIYKNRNEIINYQVNKNVLILNQLITKVTLRLDGKTVTIIKKKTADF